MTATAHVTPARAAPQTTAPAAHGSFWSEPVEELCARLRSSPRGLTSAEAERRLRELGPASIRGTTSSSTARILVAPAHLDARFEAFRFRRLGFRGWLLFAWLLFGGGHSAKRQRQSN